MFSIYNYIFSLRYLYSVKGKAKRVFWRGAACKVGNRDKTLQHKKNRNVNSSTSIDRSKRCFRCILELCADYNHMVMMAQKVNQVNSYFKFLVFVFIGFALYLTPCDMYLCWLLYLYFCIPSVSVFVFCEESGKRGPLQARLTLGLIAGAPALPLIYLSTPHTDDIRYISFIVYLYLYLYFAPTDLFIPWLCLSLCICICNCTFACSHWPIYPLAEMT